MARILVIDDEKNIRLMVAAALRQAAFDVQTAADGAEGLQKFANGEAWDLTLLDQRMPGAEGLEVLREIRRRDPAARVIMITAFGTVDLAVAAMKCGATDFLRKPFTADVLRGAVRVALGQRPSSNALAAPGTSVTYALTTLNGFNIESEPEAQMEGPAGIQNTFHVQSPDDTSTLILVWLPPHVVESVRAVLVGAPLPGGSRFWHALCEECLANHLWQHVACPPSGMLCVDHVTDPMRRWIDGLVHHH